VFCVVGVNHADLKGGAMLSDVISYALLAIVFVVTGLRMCVEKPNKIREIPMRRWGEALKRRRDR
jgi:hypothetical protein